MLGAILALPSALLRCMVVIIVFVVVARGQVDPTQSTGFPVSGVFQGGAVDSVQLNNGNLHIEIPIWSTKGRGIDIDVKFKFAYDSRGWEISTGCDPSGFCVDTVVPVPYHDAYIRLVNSNSYVLVFDNVGAPCGTNWYNTLQHYRLTDPEGTVHHFLPDEVDPPSDPCRSLNTTLYADDGSGWMLKVDPTGQVFPTAFRKDGFKVNWASGSSTVEDSNGNQVDSIVDTDTLGRTFYTDGSYLDSSGTRRYLQVTRTTVSVQTSLCQLDTNPNPCSEYTNSWSVPSTITLPNGLSYTINYVQNSYAQPSSIILPTGGQISYTWTTADTGGPVVATRTVAANGVSGTWRYQYTTLGSANGLPYAAITTISDPVGNDTKVTPLSGGNGEIGKMEYFAGTSTSGTLLKTVTTDYSLINNTFFPYLPIRVTTTWNQQNLVSKVETDWDQGTINLGGSTILFSWRNPLEVREYDWGTGAPGALLRRTHYNYLHLQNSNYLNGNIANRPTSVIVYDGSGNIKAQTTTAYDGSAVTATSGAPSHDYTNFSSSNLIRGNSTTISRWLNTNSSWLNTTSTYNDLGHLLSTTDPVNHTTSFSYADNFADGINRNAQAFVTQITYPATNGVSHIERKQFYWNTSLPAASCGQNFPSASVCTNSTSTPQPDYTKISYDLMNRPLNITRGDGGQTNFSYNDSAQPLSVSSTQSITTSLNLATTSVFDGLGRVKQSQLTSDPQGTVYTDTTYDSVGRVATVSNPYRSTSDPSYGITTYKYDALARTCVVVPPDGTAVSDSTCPATQPTNDLFTSYSANTTTVADQAGKSRKSVMDGLGRLIQVFEDPSGSNYETDYTYDTINNLLMVSQKGGSTNSANWRTRTFTYNSLSQLLTAANPESGTITYGYDNNGNLQTKVAPAPNQTGSATVTTTFTYDQLNRVTQKSFSDGITPTVKYGYDAIAPTGCTPPALTITNGIGRRTAMCDAAGVEAWSYDTMGHPLADQRTTNGVTKATTYTYNLDGSIATLTYPSGRTITYTLASSGNNTAGRMSSAVDSTGPINYATAATYTPPGSLASLTNGASLVSTLYFNNRLQPCRISVKNTGTAPASCTDTATGNVLDFSYNFSLGSSDNGNVTVITNNIDPTRSQSFVYDSLNRISVGETTSTYATSPAHCWGEQFTYDPWGNLSAITGASSAYTGCTQEALSVTPANNNQIAGFCYDAAGNLLAQSAPPCPVPTYTYNAENQMTLTAGVTYTYDGDGKRVQKSNGKLYWYGMGSDPLDETDLGGNTNNSSFNEYTFFDGKRIARRDSTNAVNYYFADHLGTARIVANSSGTPVDDSDFYPFGGERPILSSSGNSYKFTAKERDSESGLDNFGARYDASSLGRFMSPDPANVGATYLSPQTWNAYSYVANNPLNAVDPTGLDCIYINNDTGKYEGFNRGDCDNSTEEKANTGYYVDGTVNTITTTTGDDTGVVTGYSGTGDAPGTLISGTFSRPLSTTPSDALNPNAVAIFSDINRRNILNNTLKIYGAGAVIGATGGAACYYLCPSAGATTLGLAGGTAGLEGGVSEAVIQGVQELAELAQTGETQQAQAYVRALAETPQGQAVLRAMERQLSASISQMGPEFGGPQALRLFQTVKAIIEPFVRF